MNSGLHPSMVCEPSNGTVADISALLRASAFDAEKACAMLRISCAFVLSI